MTNLFLTTPLDGYWFNREEISKVENLKDAKYLGYWTKKSKSGAWSGEPVDVFYQKESHPEGSNYFGLFRVGNRVYITDAASCFSEPIIGVICEDGEVLVSRYQHDYVEKGDRIIDGGRDYIRSSIHPTATVTIQNGEFNVSKNPNI